MKAAIIGLGWQGRRHYQALAELGIELICVVDVNPGVVREKFPEYPPEKISDNPDILKQYKPDVAIISTNAAARLNCVKYCLEAGIRKIFAEKPLATNLGDAWQMKKLADSAGCSFVVNHLRRFNPNYSKLKKILEEGTIGKIEHLYAQAGSVGLGNEGTHIIDKMRFCTGSDPEWVIGFLDKTGTPNPRGRQYKDPGGWGMIMFKDGTRAFIDTCEDTGVCPVFEIVGTYGRIVIEELNNNWKIFARSREDRKIPLTKIPTPLKESVISETLGWDVKEFTKRGLEEFILQDKASCSISDGIKALETIVAFHLSDKKPGQRIFLPLTEENFSLDIPWA